MLHYSTVGQKHTLTLGSGSGTMLGMQEAPKPSDRRYHVWLEIVKPFTHTGGARLRLGHKEQLTVEPALTHDEACIYLTKLTKYPWRREYLVEVLEEYTGTCGACAEVYYTGVTTAAHNCEEGKEHVNLPPVVCVPL